MLNVTVTEPEAGGFVTVYPCGVERPNASNLNYSAGTTIPNAVTVQLGAGGKVCVFTLATTHLIVDINGYQPNGSSFGPLAPARLLDTRSGDGIATVDGQHRRPRQAGRRGRRSCCRWRGVAACPSTPPP